MIVGAEVSACRGTCWYVIKVYLLCGQYSYDDVLQIIRSTYTSTSCSNDFFSNEKPRYRATYNVYYRGAFFGGSNEVSLIR